MKIDRDEACSMREKGPQWPKHGKLPTERGSQPPSPPPVKSIQPVDQSGIEYRGVLYEF